MGTLLSSSHFVRMSSNNVHSSGLSATPDVDAVILEYLKSKGYRDVEAAMREQVRFAGSRPLSDIAESITNDQAVINAVKFHDDNEFTSDRYQQSYQLFSDWVLSSLELYKNELSKLLFPVMVHCYLDLVKKGFTDDAIEFLNKHGPTHQLSHP